MAFNSNIQSANFYTSENSICWELLLKYSVISTPSNIDTQQFVCMWAQLIPAYMFVGIGKLLRSNLQLSGKPARRVESTQLDAKPLKAKRMLK